MASVDRCPPTRGNYPRVGRYGVQLEHGVEGLNNGATRTPGVWEEQGVCLRLARSPQPAGDPDLRRGMLQGCLAALPEVRSSPYRNISAILCTR